jgi:hypothetical protein
MALAQVLAAEEQAIPSFINRQWVEKTGDHAVLRFPTRSAEGFDVEIHASEDTLTVYADVAHLEIDEPTDAVERVREGLKLVQDLLSSRMRLKVWFAGNSAYRWGVEKIEQDQWKPVFLTGLLFWNYFGRRRQEIRQNQTS